MFFSKNTVWRATTKRQQLLFLILSCLGAMVHSAYAGSVYQCKQADGRVAFQQTPCAPSDVQQQVGTTSTTAPTAKASETSERQPRTQTMTIRSPVSPVCAQTGRALFRPDLPLTQTPPPKNIKHSCKVKLPHEFNENELCIDACYLGWYGEFSKKTGPISAPPSSAPQTGATR